MDALLDPAKIEMFLFFAVPGIVVLYVRAQFLTGKLPPTADGAVAYITVSLFYHGAAFIPLTRLFPLGETSRFPPAIWVLALFVLPALLGLLLGLNVRKGWSKKLLARVRLNTVHPIDSAWDWRFSGCEACWVLAVLKDGTQWAGYLGSNSFMSSDPVERDLFIQQVFEVDKTGKWTPRRSSVWLAHGEIQSLEFWPDTQEKGNG